MQPESIPVNQFSLLWTHIEQPKYISLNEKTLHDLGFDDIFELLISNEQERKYLLHTLSMLCYEPSDITYRQEIFQNLYENHALSSSLSDALLCLQTLDDLQHYRSNHPKENSSIWEMIHYLKELQVYIESIETLKNAFEDCSLTSNGLNTLKNIVTSIYEESGFTSLKKDICELTDDVSKINSLTLGVNLDENLNPTEVILTSINEGQVRRNDGIMNRFAEFVQKSAALNNGDFRMVHGMKKMALTERDSIMLDLTNNIEKSLSDIIQKMKRGLSKYVNLEGYQILKLIPEIRLYLHFVKMIRQLEHNGFSVSKPEIIQHTSGKRLCLEDFYNIRLAFTMISQNDKDMITNSLSFDDKHRIYILTGPNRGGKTILTQAVGQAVILMQMGCYVPCLHMKGSPVEGIYTHFPADENDTLSYGRLGEESMRMHEIIEQITDKSLLLLNETYATTSFSDGLYMAKDLVHFLKIQDINCIYNTHLHELAKETNTLNKADGNGTIVSLVMGIEQGKRIFKAQLREPDGNSYATDIAHKYGVTLKQMLALKDVT